MKKTLKKGFTIVELVIVIAVVAILAAVLIPTFVSVVNKANVSNDTALVRNINTVLATEEVTDGKPATMYDALKMAENGGFDVSKLTPRSTGDIVWDSETNRFALVDGDNTVYSDGNKQISKSASVWKIVDSDKLGENTGYSSYVKGKGSLGDIVVTTGIDLGENKASSVTYNGGTSAKNVTIRTIGNTALTVNGYVDSGDSTKGDVIYHYGESGTLDVVKCASASFHEYGIVNGEVTVKEGHFVVESGAAVSQMITIGDTTGSVKISAKEVVSIFIAENVANDIKIESDKSVYLDDKENKVANKPGNVIFPTEINSENSFTTKENFELLKNNGMTDPQANVLEGYYKLTADIEVKHLLYVKEGASAIVDLNGHNINSTFTGFVFCNWGTLTINDSSNGNACVYNSTKETGGQPYFRHDAIRNFGSIIINGGRFGDNNTDETDKNESTYGAALRNQIGATCVINGGYFTCGDNGGHYSNNDNFYSYAIRSFGEMVINDCKVYGAMNGGVAADAGHIEINGGTFSVSGKDSYHVITNNVSAGASTTINGGVFEKNNNDKFLLSGFNGMPSWDAAGALASNGYVVNGGRFIKDGVEVKIG